MIDPKLHERLKEINTELTTLEKQIIKTAFRLDANLLQELNNDIDGIIDYELDVLIYCYGVDGSDYPLCTLEEDLKQCSVDNHQYGLNDGENHNEFQFRENHPMFGECHCWLFHCLYDHNYLTWEEIASIQNFWIDVKPSYQYRCDIPDSSFSPPTRHLIYSNNYQSIFNDAVRDSVPDFADNFFHPFVALRKISRSLWGDTARLTLKPMSDEELSIFHTPEYLQSLRQNKYIIEEIIGCTIPSSITMSMVNEYLIDAARSMITGTVAAAKLALETGWAINIGGGFPHATRESGGNYCFFNDYAIAANYLWKTNPELKILYIDLDALMGSGIEEITRHSDKFYVFDMSNAFKKLETYSISKAPPLTLIALEPHTEDKMYLGLLQEHLPALIDSIQPDIIFYHAGSNVLEGNTTGQLSISPEGMKERDLFIFDEAKKQSIPIIMCLGSGYEKENYRHIVDSLEAVIELMEG